MTEDKIFNCLCCGECCRGDMHVYLNPDDLDLMARSMRFDSTKKLFDEKYVIIDKERNNAPLPRIRFSKGPAGCCPFLENRLIEKEDALSGESEFSLQGLCRLHPENKPLICWLAPQHRVVDLDTNDEIWGVISPLPGCPGTGGENLSGSPERFQARLDSERNFFKKLADMLDNDESDEKIISSLYYLNII